MSTPSATAVETPVLEVRDVKVHFGGVKAVDGITFDITPGKIFGILGPNGSGKSTLLAAFTRYVNLTAGSLRLAGEEYDTVPTAQVARRGVARTFQTVRLLPGLTVRENIELGADLAAGGELLWAAPIAQWCRVDFRSRRRRRGHPADRAGGARAGVARRALVRLAATGRDRPRHRHPAAAAPARRTDGRHELRRAARGLAAAARPEAGGVTQLLVEHDVQMMLDTCDWLIAMNFGKLIAEGPPEDVVREDSVREAYLGKRWGRRA